MIRIILSSIVLCAGLIPLHAEELLLLDPLRPEEFYQPNASKRIKNVKTVVAEKEVKSLILRQTIISSQRRFAIINGFTLREGERIKGGFQVMQINDDNVILLRGDKEFVLYLAGKTNIKEISR